MLNYIKTKTGGDTVRECEIASGILLERKCDMKFIKRLIKNANVEELYDYVLPWVETHFDEPDINGYVCKLERKDDPNFIEFFKDKEDMWNRVEEIERQVQFPSKMEVIKHD